MAGKTLDLSHIVTPDQLASSISNKFVEWNMLRQTKIKEWQELRNYIYATDTRHTSNAKLPWSNTTTIPKLTQIRDNLNANYMAAMFPKRRWLDWEGATKDDSGKRKRKAIKDYMMFAVSQPQFKEEVRKLILDYIDYGNVFCTIDWTDQTTEVKGQVKSTYVGPMIRRISPHDIVFNPVAQNFSQTPKIIRALVTLGEAKAIIDQMSSTPDDKIVAEKIWQYCMELRQRAAGLTADEGGALDQAYQVDGFTSYRAYLGSDYVELLTLMGDYFDREKGVLYRNHIITVIDRHKIVLNKPHSYPLAEIPIWHQGWRIRQDNLWAMGPLDNLVGMQYRLDHVENMKADLVDITTLPPIHIKGLVEPFEWGPLTRIHTDSDGDVKLLVDGAVGGLQMNIETSRYEELMESMAGSPKEAMGFRTPGEKTAYEVQRLENAAARIFQNKIVQFEEGILEPALNGMFNLAKQNLQTSQIRVLSEEFGAESFLEIKNSDIDANGRLKPVAARHFAEKAERVQNISNFMTSALGTDEAVRVHFSSIRLAKMIEELLDVEDYELVTPYIRLSEAADAQRQQNSYDEETMIQTQQPSGLAPEDFTGQIGQGIPPQAAQ